MPQPAGRPPAPASLARFLVRRLVFCALTLLVASIAVFGLLSVLPGNPAEVILGTQATPAAVHAKMVQLGLDIPLWLQWAHWTGGLLSGRLGTSYISRQAIGPQISAALGVTGPLVGFGLAIGLVVGVGLGTLSALRHRRLSGAILASASQLGIAVPNFVAGILLVIVFGVKLGWLPTSGFGSGVSYWSQDFPGAVKALVLPSLALGLAEGAVLSRYVRSAVLDVLRSDFLRTARSKGLRPGQALLRHGLRNAAAPVLTVLGLELAGLLVGAVVLENVFELPGLGMNLVQWIENRDLLAVQDVVMLIAGTVLVVNLLVDVGYRLLDPRVALR
jgi:peptide/nickel transport system permease protein